MAVHSLSAQHTLQITRAMCERCSYWASPSDRPTWHARGDRASSLSEDKDYQLARQYCPTRCRARSHHLDSNGHHLGQTNWIANSRKYTMADLNRNHLH